MKTIILFLFLIATFNSAVSENHLPAETLVGACEDNAVDVYNGMIGAGATWSEAAGAFHIMYTDCCFNYTYDCPEMAFV